MTTRPLNGIPLAAPVFPPQVYIFPSPIVPPDAPPLFPSPLATVRDLSLRTPAQYQRPALVSLDNSLSFPPASVDLSPMGLEAFLRAKIAARVLATANGQGENNTLTPSRFSVVIPSNPSSGAIPYTGCIVPPQQVVFVQDGTQPQPVPAAAQQQPTRRKRKELDWKDGTPAAYQPAIGAKAETSAKTEQSNIKPANVLYARTDLLKNGLQADPAIKSEGAEQQQPELTPVRVPARRASRIKKEAKAGIDFQETLTPDNFRETLASRRTSGNSTFYQSSDESLDASESLFKAADHIEQKRYQAAIGAIYQAMFFLHEKQGFIYLLMIDLSSAMRTTTDPRITSSEPEKDLDVLILRGMYKIKHAKYESAKIDLEQVLTYRPQEQLAQILLNHANYIINRPADLNWTPAGKTPKQELAGTPSS